MDDNWGLPQDLEAILLDGQNAGGNSATNLGTVQAVTGLFDVVDIGDVTINGSIITTSNDMNVSYMGYPKLTLTTNMMSVVSDGGTIIPANDWAPMIDGDYTTETTSAGSILHQGHIYMFELGAKYTGYIVARVVASNYLGTIFYDACYSSDGIPSIDASVNGGTYSMKGVLGQPGVQTNIVSSRMVNAGWAGVAFEELTSQWAQYRICEISIYGITNDFRNAGDI